MGIHLIICTFSWSRWYRLYINNNLTLSKKNNNNNNELYMCKMIVCY